jgi:hypothetical protein
MGEGMGILIEGADPVLTFHTKFGTDFTLNLNRVVLRMNGLRSCYGASLAGS